MAGERKIVKGHEWDWDYTPETDTHTVRCECGWEAWASVSVVDEALDAHLEEAEKG